MHLNPSAFLFFDHKMYRRIWRMKWSMHCPKLILMIIQCQLMRMMMICSIICSTWVFNFSTALDAHRSVCYAVWLLFMRCRDSQCGKEFMSKTHSVRAVLSSCLKQCVTLQCNNSWYSFMSVFILMDLFVPLPVCLLLHTSFPTCFFKKNVRTLTFLRKIRDIFEKNICFF